MDINQVGLDQLKEYSEIPISFCVRSFLEVSTVAAGLGGLRLDERSLAQPYLKDYDTIEDDASPLFWPEQFNLSNWAFFLAREAGRSLGGAAVAWNTNGVHMLEGRADLAVLWDLRVRPDARGQGIGRRLFAQAESWARQKGCRQIKVETQNINVPACRFYVRMGCQLGQMHRYAYAGVPGCESEVMLCWYKDLQ